MPCERRRISRTRVAMQLISIAKIVNIHAIVIVKSSRCHDTRFTTTNFSFIYLKFFSSSSQVRKSSQKRRDFFHTCTLTRVSRRSRGTPSRPAIVETRSAFTTSRKLSRGISDTDVWAIETRTTMNDYITPATAATLELVERVLSPVLHARV